MRKLIFFLPGIALLLAFLFVFPPKVSAFSKCYTLDSLGQNVLIGDMTTWMELGYFWDVTYVNFICIGGKATVEFADKSGDVESNQVQFKTGNSGWFPYQSTATYYSWEFSRNYTSYFLDFSPTAADQCSAYYVNVMWRSKADGKLHYCDDITTNFQAPQNDDAKFDTLDASYSLGSFSGKLLIWDPSANNLWWSKGMGQKCSDYGLYVNKQLARKFQEYPSGWCEASDIFSEHDVSGNSLLRVRTEGGVSPGPVFSESGLYSDSLHLLTYAPNPPNTCGGCQYCGPPPVPPTVCTTCPCTQTQEGGSCNYSLTNVYESADNPDYKPYVEFTPKTTGSITKVSVKAGNWGNAWRGITCKFKDVWNGQESVEKTSATFRAEDGIAWRELNFTSKPFELVKDRPYRLYCRGPANEAWLTLYWMYVCGDVVYGKDYKWEMTICPPPLACSSAILSPSSFTLVPTQTQVVQVTGLAGSLALLDKDVDHVTFTSSNPSVVSVSPASDNTYPFQTTATGVAIGGPVTITAGIFLKPDDGTKDCSGTATVTVEELVNAWFQTQEGDVHAGGDIASSIPTSVTERNFSITPTGGYPGIVSYGGDAFFGDGFPSANQANHWLAKTSSTRYSYNYFYQLLDSPTTDNFNGELSEITADGVYYSANEVVINNKWDFPSGRKVAILINGKLTINKEIIVPVGSSLAFIVKGDIEIKGVIGDKAGTPGANTPDIEGIYITDGTLKTNYDEDQAGFLLLASGIFVANQVSLGRDLKNDNDIAPAEKFLYRPDLLINSYSGLWRSTSTWQELAP